MNIVAVFLGIIIVILIYILYTYITQKPIDINNLVYLKTDTKTIDASLIKNPTASTFSYAFWVYINSWDTVNIKPLLKHGDVNFKIYLDNLTPTLKLDYIHTTSTSESFNLMSNFPIQKWCYVIVSVDNQILDFYLDGKLVLSSQLNGTPVITNSVNSGDTIVIGDSNIKQDIYLAKISRWPNAVDPQTAWDTYMNGNGQSNALNNMYNMKLSVLKNNIETKEFSLF
jgi:hypothetical protein